MSNKNEQIKIITLHVPLSVWKQLMLKKVEGEIKSLNSAIVVAINEYLGKND